MLIPLGILAGAGGGPPGDYELIQTQILGSAQSSVVFDNLATYASTYKHLQVRAAARFSFAEIERGMYLRINGDTGSNYAFHHLFGVGSGSASSAAGANQTSIAVGSTPSASATANVYGAMVLDLLDPYSTTKNKTVRVLSGSAGSGVQNWIALMSGVRLNTASITSLTFLEPNSGSNFVAGSRFSLYGIRG
jgi:hypothetical protein